MEENENDLKELVENLKRENKIMRRVIVENGLWEILLNDDEFIKYLNEE